MGADQGAARSLKSLTGITAFAADGRAFDFSRIGGPVFAVILALTSLFTALLFEMRAEKIFWLPAAAEEAVAEDLVAFYRAADLASEGLAADAYDAASFREGLGARHKGLLWLNPPHALLAVAPLDNISYGSAKFALLALTALTLFIVARLAKAPWWMAAALMVSPASFASLLVLQTGALIAAGLLGSLTLAQSRPIAAGFILALLTMKPQYGLMAPIFLAACGHWRAIGWGAAFTMALVALSVWRFGAAPWAAFFESVAGGAISAHGAGLHRDMLSAGSTLMKLGAGPLSGAGQLAVIAVCAAVTYIAARRLPREAALGIALLASAAASPSLWVYDWPLVAAGLLVLARAFSPWPPLLQLAAGLLWIGPLYSLGMTTMASSLIAPALLALTLALACAETLKARPAPL